MQRHSHAKMASMMAISPCKATHMVHERSQEVNLKALNIKAVALLLQKAYAKALSSKAVALLSQQTYAKALNIKAVTILSPKAYVKALNIKAVALLLQKAYAKALSSKAVALLSQNGLCKGILEPTGMVRSSRLRRGITQPPVIGASSLCKEHMPHGAVCCDSPSHR